MRINHLTHNTLVYGLADFLGRGFGLLILPFLAAVLSPSEFGALELILTITGLLAVIMNCGLNNATQRFYFDGASDNSENSKEVVSSGAAAIIVFGFAASIFGFVLIYISSFYIDFINVPFSIIGLIAAILLMTSGQWMLFATDVTRLHFAPYKFLILTILTRVLGLSAGTYVVVSMGWGIDGFLSMQALISMCIIPLAFFMIRKDLIFRTSYVSILKLVKFGFPFIFMGLAYWIFGSMDRWMLAGMVSLEEAGIYAIAFKLSSVVLFASLAFGQAWSPFALKLKQVKPKIYKLVFANILYCLLFLMIILGGFVSLFSGELIAYVLPFEYHQSAYLLSILCIGLMLQASIHVTAIGISLENKTNLFARIAWVTALFNLCLNFMLIPNFGAVGAAIATSASYFLLTSLYFFYTQKLHRLPINFFLITFLLIIGLTILCASLAFHSLEFHITLVSLKLIIYFALILASLGALYYKEVFKNLKSNLD